MKSVVVGTAGHIDHGKSALVRALTGTDPDRLKEEKARGITIDLGFAHAAVDGINFAFVDVPGHERFVKNMLAGVGGIDLVVLVVAADESVMPQTREHFDICRLLRVTTGVVALTKSDLADADTLEIATMEVRELVAGSFLEGAPIVPVSAKTGDGLEAFRAALVNAGAKAATRSPDAAARLPIDRVFSMKGFGTVVTGTLVTGRIRVDDELAVEPGGRRLKVRGVQVHGRKESEAVAGQRAAINLSGVEVADLSRGQALVTADSANATRLADATLELLPGVKPLKQGVRVRLHQGTAEVLSRVSRFDDPRFVRLRLESPAVLARGDRYVLRAYSPPVTIAGGVILDPHPPRTAMRAPVARARMQALDFDPATGDRAGADLRAAAALMAESGGAGLPVAALTTRLAVDSRDVDARIAALSAAKQAIRAGDVLVAPSVVAALKESIVSTLTAHHRAQPLSEGIPRDELAAQAWARLPGRSGAAAKAGAPAVYERALADLTAAGTIAVRERVALSTHRLELSPEEERARAAIERAYRDGGLAPPDAAGVAASAGAPPAVADRILKLLQRQKVLVRVDTLLFHDDALKRLKAEIAAMKAAQGGQARIDVATFKERYGVTRKFAIPLLEYLDRERVTRRVGDARVVL